MSAGLLFDSTRCIGCQACSEACKEENHLPPTIEPTTTAYTWTIVTERKGGVNVRRPVHALPRADLRLGVPGRRARQDGRRGRSCYDAGKCIGCRYCIMACPFDVPKYQWDRAVPVVGKCVMCADRASRKGEPTACAAACPTGATMFGERDALARARRARGSPTTPALRGPRLRSSTRPAARRC